jgi:hypothetical protein
LRSAILDGGFEIRLTRLRLFGRSPQSASQRLKTSSVHSVKTTTRTMHFAVPKVKRRLQVSLGLMEFVDIAHLERGPLVAGLIERRESGFDIMDRLETVMCA